MLCIPNQHEHVVKINSQHVYSIDSFELERHKAQVYFFSKYFNGISNVLNWIYSGVINSSMSPCLELVFMHSFVVQTFRMIYSRINGFFDECRNPFKHIQWTRVDGSINSSTSFMYYDIKTVT